MGGVPLCALVNEYMNRLAPRFPTTKFIRAISTTCIPNYPDKNLPTIFVYHEGQLKGQMVGPIEFRGMNLTMDEFEYQVVEIALRNLVQGYLGASLPRYSLMRAQRGI